MKYVCDICGYIYDEAEGEPDNGIAPGTKWEDLPEDYVWSALRSWQRPIQQNGLIKTTASLKCEAVIFIYKVE